MNTETECNEEKSSDVKPNVEGTKTEGKVDKQTVRPRRQRGKHRTSQFTLIGFARYVFTKLTLFFQASNVMQISFTGLEDLAFMKAKKVS